MRFYSGFSLTNDEQFFKDFLDESELCVAGFSYGAIGATKKTIELLRGGVRVDRLQLFSPAFFQDRDMKFKKLQMLGYKKDKKSYIENFIKNSFSPYEVKEVSLSSSSEDELLELLEYVWSEDELSFISSSGVKIEVYLGGLDAIINANSAREFFLPFATITYIKDANHFLGVKQC